MRRLLLLFLLLLPWGVQAQPVMPDMAHALWRGLLLWLPVLPTVTPGRLWWDLGPYRLHGTLAGTYDWRGEATGRFAGTVSLDGTSYADLGDVVPLQFATTTPFSLSLWFQTSATTKGDLIVKAFDVNPWSGYWWQMMADGTLNLLLIDTSTNDIGRGTTASFNDGRLHHGVVTYDGSADIAGMVFYVDGRVVASVQTGTFASTGGAITTSAPARLGANGSLTSNFVGRLTNPMIFQRVLRASEVQALAQMQAPTYGGLLVEEPVALVQTGPVIKRRVVIE